MSQAISRLMWALVALGFLASTTMNMYGKMKKLEVENQKLAHELNQLRAQYETIVQERDALLAENANLKYQFNTIQTAYLTENQARLKAESDLETYKGMVLNMNNDVQTVFAATCTPTEKQAAKPEELLLSNIAPVGVSSLGVLTIAGLVVALIDYCQKHRRSRNVPAPIRHLHSLR